MPIYLNERELGYDPTLMGFPSISACLAVVLATDSGLYGLHNVGGSAGSQWRHRAEALKQFYTCHESRRPGVALYGVTRVFTRGYDLSPKPTVEYWKDELATFAGALSFHGPILGVNLDAGGLGGGSLYVEFRRNDAGEVAVYVKDWSDSDRTKGNLVDHKNLRFLHPTGIRQQNAQVVTHVDNSRMVRADFIRIVR